MSDPTRFDLDDRQRAILAEMGVRVWWPQAAASEPPQAEPSVLVSSAPSAAAAAPIVRPPAPVQRPVAHPPTVQAAPVAATGPAFKPLPSGLSVVDWTGLQAAILACQSCALSGARQTPVWGAGAAMADWMVVGDLPSQEDDQQGQPFTGPEGVLLDNMLKAVGVRRQGLDVAAQGQAPLAEAYLTCAVKCRPPSGRNPEATELGMCSAYLSRQVALAQPKVILAMGRFAIQSLLGSTEPMGKLRGRLHDFQGVPVVVTYHPASLLRSPADKAKAWADLVLALSVVKA